MDTQSAEIKELATALAKAQAEIRPAKKDSKNPFFKSNYAGLDSIWEACRKPLTDNGLSVAQTTGYDEGKNLILFTTLMHNSGQWLKGLTPINPVKPNDAQAIGSAMTYAKRYALAAMVGVVAEDDDDGNAATGKTQDAPTPKSEPSKSSQSTPSGESLASRLLKQIKSSKNLGELKTSEFEFVKAAKNGQLSKEEGASLAEAVKAEKRQLEGTK